VPLERVEQVVEVAGRRLSILKPPDPEALLDEEAFDREEFLPYWAELWPSALALAEAVAARGIAGARVVELGCGLAIPSIVAALAGAEVIAADWSPDAVEFAAENARRNGASLETLHCSWAAPEPLLARAPFDLVLAADVLYERRDVALLLDLLPRLAPEALVAEPGRPPAREFFAAVEAEEVAERVYAIRH
jgi:predicted nicotinamide N-methyase